MVEPDWTQTDPTADQVKQWMREHAFEHLSAAALARAAHEHFRRPYHLNVLLGWAEAAMERSK
jgi:hypothetical protein